MDLTQHPELAERLAAAYALGTLRGGARRRFEAQARQSPTLRAAALAWNERFAALTELQATMTPSPNVWKRIQNMLEAQAPSAATSAGKLPRSRTLRWWRFGALAMAVAALGVGVHDVQLMSQLRSQPEIEYVAVLSDDRAAASVLVTFDPKRSTLTLKRLGGFNEGPDKSLQLWALAPSGGPKSLGVLTDAPVIRLAAAEAQVRQAPVLAISLEPKGGVAGDRGPTGPVLFKGALLQTP
jgi:anti-sigma-K factor RskA